MRVECSNLSEFIQNLELEKEGTVYNNVIYVNIIDQPIDGDKRDSVRTMVVFRVSTIVNVGDGEGQYLLNSEEECGIDYNDMTQEKNGINAANIILQRLEVYCEEHNLKIRPGIVDF